ncbi:MAG: hypothetical protein AAB956_01910 [Patescibacteria group bacterium]
MKKQSATPDGELKCGFEGKKPPYRKIFKNHSGKIVRQEPKISPLGGPFVAKLGRLRARLDVSVYLCGHEDNFYLEIYFWRLGDGHPRDNEVIVRLRLPSLDGAGEWLVKNKEVLVNAARISFADDVTLLTQAIIDEFHLRQKSFQQALSADRTPRTKKTK